MRKLQAQGVHHITIVGADRRTSIDFWEGVLGMPFVFEQPNFDNASESHLYFDPGDGRLITIFTNEEREPEPNPTPRQARDRALRGQGPRLHGLDLLRGSARTPDRAGVLSLRASAGPYAHGR